MPPEQTTDGTNNTASAATAAATAPTVNATGTNGGKQAAVSDNAKHFTQEDLDRIVEERLTREKEKSVKATEKARAEAEAKTLAEQGEFKKLHEQAQARVGELEKAIAEAEPLKENVKRLEKALAGYRDAQFADVPEHIQSLLKRMDVVEQLEWLTANKGKVASTPDAEKKAPSGTPRSNGLKRQAPEPGKVEPIRVQL